MSWFVGGGVVKVIFWIYPRIIVCYHVVNVYVEYLLQDGRTPFHDAIQSSASEEVIRLLMEAHPDAVKEKDKVSGGTCLTNVLLNI